MLKNIKAVAFDIDGTLYPASSLNIRLIPYVVKHLFFYLESKRILTNPIEMEIANQCVEAVLEIKNMLISITQDVEFSNENIHLT